MAALRQDAIALLKADHRKVAALFEKFEKARTSATKQRLANEICAELVTHATIEEEIFYPACKGKIENDLLSESYVEHDGAKVLIAEIQAGDPEHQFFDAKMKVLSEDIEHHVEEEEKRSTGVFAQARAAGVDMEALARRMLERKRQLAAQGPAAPKTRTFTGHRLEAGEPPA
jgi:hemerythrin superfamily protein